MTTLTAQPDAAALAELFDGNDSDAARSNDASGSAEGGLRVGG